MGLTPRQAGQRKRRIEEGYEALLLTAARSIVDPATTEEQRARAQESLLDACSRMSAFHSLDAGRLYWKAIEFASNEGKKDG